MINDDRPMYRWREMTEAERIAAVAERKQHGHPWHSPPHYDSDSGLYLMTAACYEHRPIIGTTSQRMADFEKRLLDQCEAQCQSVFTWNILPNHYHVVVQSADVKGLLVALGQLHGHSSYDWNGEESKRGRKVWFNANETAMKSERHFWTTVIYVLNNAVRHGYVKRWQDWPYCNAAEFLQSHGRDHVAEMWHEYPLLDYGKTWDPPDL